MSYPCPDHPGTSRSATGGEILPAALIDAVSRFGSISDYPKNTTVVTEGEAADSMYIIVTGRLKVFTSNEAGHEFDLNQLGPGQYFGELLLAKTRRTASVRTITAARLSRIQRADFERTLVAHPDLAFHLIRNLIERVSALTDNVRSLALMDVYQRVAQLFNDAAISDGKSIVVPYMSQQTIATRVGSSRSMVNRILKDLTDGGYITIRRGGIALNRVLPKRW